MDHDASGNAVVPASSFNYGFFDADLYTAANVDKWYGETISAEMKAEYVKIGKLNEKIEALKVALTADDQKALAQEIEQLVCGTYYKIPLYSANNLYVYSTQKWTGWTAVDNEPIMNSQTFKNLTRVAA